ncbi:uncharacterized protein MEPE_01957 [Melanopsichium pennsylvanicum]|uniref:Transcription factor Iwr1 domain-containing protein n=1 Tax=Melanopsichium pennsylvanicum TaxID=63383 RepID=A0AAJ5C429_9BASI|nr:uncharacterized protein MEPE_01957 [Melanopsichium pennsylvanicum]
MILRIKRKRNQDPVDALIIAQNERKNKRRSIVFPNQIHDKSSSSNQTLSRNNVDKQQQQQQRGVFRLAETVSLESFSDPIAARKLHQRISALTRGFAPSTNKALNPSKLAQSVSSASLTHTALQSQQAQASCKLSNNDNRELPAYRSLTSSLDCLTPSTDGYASATPEQRLKVLASQQIDRDKHRRSRSNTPVGMRFKVISKEIQCGAKGLRRSGSCASLRKSRNCGVSASCEASDSEGPSKPWHTPPGPPVIRSKKQNQAEAMFGRIIDAETQPFTKLTPRSALTCSKSTAPEQQDDEMGGLNAKFAEMLGDYLRSNNMEPSQDLEEIAQNASKAAAIRTGGQADESDDAIGDEQDDDYVYDVYYRDLMPTKAGPQGSAETGLQPAQVAGRERKNASLANAAVADSMALRRIVGGQVVTAESTREWFGGLEFGGGNAVIASLEGFEDSEDELEQAEEEGFESFDEGEDEDSNDEGFYRNDYPEQELAEADEVEFDYDDNHNDDGDDDDFDEDHDEYSLSDGSF